MEETVPDLYVPGCFRCPKCGFALSRMTLNARTGEMGTTELDRQSEECPNDGTFMVHVTYREQVTAYAERLKEELGHRDRLEEVIRKARHGMTAVHGLEVADEADIIEIDFSAELAACDAVCPAPADERITQ